MANLNKVMLIGRLTDNPEEILLRNGSRGGAKFRFAVNNRKLNQDTQQWEDVPVFMDMEIWNRGENKQGDRLLQTVRKGQQIFVEGHLRLDTWEAKPEQGGGKRNKLVVVVENFQYLEPRADGGNGGNGGNGGATSQPRQSGAAGGNRGFSSGPGESDEQAAPAYSKGGGNPPEEDNIPF